MNKKGCHAKTEKQREHVEKYREKIRMRWEKLKEVRRKERADRSVVPSLRKSARR